MSKRNRRSKLSAPARSATAVARPAGLPPEMIVVIKALVIIAVGTAILYPVLNGPWAGDDAMYLFGNKLMLDPHRLWKAWFAPGSFVEYYPLQETVQWFEFKSFGTDDDASPFWYRVPNLALHLISALLIWALFARMKLKFAWLGGLIFAVHPENIDSVGQITELKNTLSLPPFLLSLIFFIDYEENKSPRAYLLTLGFFIIAMLCKITMAFFPFFIPIYAWWKRGRITWRDATDALPFLCVSLILAYLTIHAGDVYAKGTAYSNPGQIYLGGFASRLALTGMTLAFYFSRCFFPLDPRPVYPLWNVDPPTPSEFLPWLGVILVLAACWIGRRTWGRHVILGLSFFTLGVLPFLGFHEVTYFCLSWVQDHMLYLPMLGILGLFLAGVQHLLALLPRLQANVVRVVGCLALGLLVFQSYAYASIYAYPLKLWSYNYQSAPNSWLVDWQLGQALVLNKNYAEGVPYLKESTRINPGLWYAWQLIGEADYDMQHYADAIAPLRMAIKCDPTRLPPREFLGRSLNLLERYPEGEAVFRDMIQLAPGQAPYHGDLAISLAGEGRIDDAVQELKLAVNLDPSNAGLQRFLQQMLDAQTSAHPAK